MIPDFSELKKLRQIAGLTQAELAKRVGVSQSFIAKIENGKIDPKFSIIKKIYDELLLMINIQDTAEKIMHSPVIVAHEKDDILSVVNKMENYNISQIPVVNNDEKLIGIIYDYVLLRKIISNNIKKLTASKVMSPLPPLIQKTEPINGILRLFSRYSVVLVIDDKLHPLGIITRSDLIGFLVKHKLEEPQ